MADSPSRWQIAWPELYAPLDDLQRWLLDDALRIEESDGVNPEREFAALIIAATFTDDLGADEARARFAAWYERTRANTPPCTHATA